MSRDVLDDAVLLLEGDPVADAQRLRDGEHHACDEVGERLAGGEADDRGGDRAGGEQRSSEPVDAVHARQRDRDAEKHDRGSDKAAEEAQAGAGLGRDPAGDDRVRQLGVAAREHAVEQERGQQRDRDRHDDRRPGRAFLEEGCETAGGRAAAATATLPGSGVDMSREVSLDRSPPAASRGRGSDG